MPEDKKSFEARLMKDGALLKAVGIRIGDDKTAIDRIKMAAYKIACGLYIGVSQVNVDALGDKDFITLTELLCTSQEEKEQLTFKIACLIKQELEDE